MPLTYIRSVLEADHALLLDIYAATHETRGEVKSLSRRVERLEDRPPLLPSPPQAVAAVEILKAVAPAGGWFPWLLMAVLALTGIVKPEQVRDFALGSRSAPSVERAPE